MRVPTILAFCVVATSCCFLSSSVVATKLPRRRRLRQNQRLLRIPIENRGRESVVWSGLLEKKTSVSEPEPEPESESESLLELELGLDLREFAGELKDASMSISMSMQQRLLLKGKDEEEMRRQLESSFFMDHTSMSMSMAGESSSTSCSVPSAFDANKNNKIYVIMNIDTGEYFELLIDGMVQQASKMGSSSSNVEVEVEVRTAISPDKEITAQQGDLIVQALNDGATGIITVDGSSAILCDAIREAIDAGVPVVSFDFDGTDTCAPTGHLLTTQSNSDMAEMVLIQAAKDHNNNTIDDYDTTKAAGLLVPVGYVNDLNYLPLQERDVVWEADSKKYGWDQEFFVKDAASFPTPEALQEAIIAQFQQLEDNDNENNITTTTAIDIQFMYAPWDYLAINTLAALEQIESDADVYGADINNEDIAAMTKPNSHWKATAGGHPKMIGAAILRMCLLQMADVDDGQMVEQPQFIKMPSFLFTQDFLLKNKVANLSDLLEAMPELRLEDTASACWIEPVD